VSNQLGQLPFAPNMNDSSLLCDFVTDCHLPETIQVVDGYESLESEELSWSIDEIVNLHTLREVSRIIARDEKGNYFSVPLTYQGKIFESIPKGCKDRYETVEELIVAFPKYVRSLRDIPQSGVTDGDILLLLEASPNSGGQNRLKCSVVGRPRTIFLPSNQFGPFETLEDDKPSSIREVIDGHRLPTYVRVLAGKTQAFDGTNTSPRVIFEGLLCLEEAVKQKVFVVSTLKESLLRVLKLPIDLEITVKREDSKIDSSLFSHICHLIETEVDIDSTITCGSTGDASWYFDISEARKKSIQTANNNNSNNNVYEELRPAVPPRSPTKAQRSNLKQNSKKDVADTRYAPTPKPKPKKTATVELVAPPVARKPNKVASKQPGKAQPPNSEPPIPKRRNRSEMDNSAKSTLQNRELSHVNFSLRAVPQNCRQSVDILKDKEMIRKGENSMQPQVKERIVLPDTCHEDNVYESIVDVASDAETFKHSHMPKHTEHSRSVKTVLPDFQHAGALGQNQQPTSNQSHPSTDDFHSRLEGISVSEVSEWLKKLGLSQYVDLFIEEAVDGTMLSELNEEMMQCLGIKNPLHRRKLTLFIERGWTPKQ